MRAKTHLEGVKDRVVGQEKEGSSPRHLTLSVSLLSALEEKKERECVPRKAWKGKGKNNLCKLR